MKTSLFEGFYSSFRTLKTLQRILWCYSTPGQRPTITAPSPARLRLLHAQRRLQSHRSAQRMLSTPAPIASRCSGCGSLLQWQDPLQRGYVPLDKLGEAGSLEDGRGGVEREEETEGEVVAEGNTGERDPPSPQLICKRCFSLKHYNTALNVTLQAHDYLSHLSHLRDKRALILLVVDVIDFPGSLFPDLHTLASPASQVVIVANKIDLLPRDVDGNFWNRVRALIVDECKSSSLKGCSVAGVVFTSMKSGEGLDKLTDFVVEYWGNRGDVYLLGCTNVGKSSLFNHLLDPLWCHCGSAGR